MATTRLGTSIRRMLAAASLLLVAGSAMAWPILPAAPCNGQNCLQYSDFSVYSMALINLQGGGSGAPTNGEPGYVDASAGQIKDFIVVGTGDNGVPVNTNIAGVDNAYGTNALTSFNSMTSDPGNGPGVGDGLGWQASISAVRSQFVNSNFVAFFSFTEPGSSDSPKPLTGADMLVWAKMSVIDLQDPGATKSFYLQPNGSIKSDNPMGDPLPPDTTLDFVGGGPGPWTYVHSQFCVGPGGVFYGFPTSFDQNGQAQCAQGSVKNVNTGSNNASFAIYNAELDAIIHDANTQYDILQVDWQMAYIDGGGEKAWFEPWQIARTQVPEPGTVLLMGLALVGLWFTRRGQAARS